MALKLLSLNLERSKHLDRVLPLISAFRPDAACFQELCVRDIPRFEDVLGMRCVFAPVAVHPDDAADPEGGLEGVGIFAPEGEESVAYYKGSAAHAAVGLRRKAEDIPLVSRAFVHGGSRYHLASTHFTLSERGKASDEQRADMRALLALLAPLDEVILCGDLNAPRGGEIFGELAQRYADAIPPRYETSLDVSLHRAGTTNAAELADKMVDGLFVSAAYLARDVQLVFGVSDHAAITAAIERR